MLLSITVKDIENSYIVEFSDPKEVLFKEGHAEFAYSAWHQIPQKIEEVLNKFKQKAR